MTPPDVQLGLMLDLPGNWDGYGAARIDPAVVEVAQEFVRLLMAVRGSDNLFVSPGSNGNVGIEREDTSTRFDLDVNVNGTLELLREDKASGAVTTDKYTQQHFAAPASMFGSVRRLLAA